MRGIQSLCRQSRHTAAPAQLKETLQFLDGGTRGFYARLEGLQDNITLRVGDTVFADDSK